jgi:hypothetical protein
LKPWLQWLTRPAHGSPLPRESVVTVASAAPAEASCIVASAVARPPEFTDELVSQLGALLWAAPDVRKRLQQCGMHLVPSNFYSTVPSVDELDTSFEYAERTPYLSTGLFDREFLADLLGKIAGLGAELQGPEHGDHQAPAGFFWQNGQFGFSDAAAYYAFIRHFKPRRVLEVGAGFSTLVASAAITANGHGEIYCIEPYPRPFLESVPHVAQVIREPIQNICAERINDLLGDGDFLFIDSTHTVKIGSDCLHLYLRLLPALSKRLIVHVHDVFLPDAMPRDWALTKHIYWTEQYLLLAYLLDNPHVRVLFGSHYHCLFNRAVLSTMTPAGIALSGSSFWFERHP